MELRLGMLECPGCGHEMEPPPVEVEEVEDDGRPLRRLEGWQRAAGVPVAVAGDGDKPSFRLAMNDMAERGSKRDTGRGELGAEKVFVIVLFLAMGTFNVITAFQGEFASASDFSLPWLGALMVELLRMGLILLVLYYPFLPLKWCGISAAGLGMIHALANLWLVADNRSLFLNELPFGLYTNIFDISTWLMYCINVAVFLIVMSVLGRDMQKV